MTDNVPGFTAAQLDGLACIGCGSESTPQRPTGDRGPTGAQLFRCADNCPAFVNGEQEDGR